MGFYDALLRAEPSPVVELNRAAAVAMRDGPAAGLSLVDAILARGELLEYPPGGALRARADLRRLGKASDAAAAYGRAMELTTQTPELRFWRGGWASCAHHSALGSFHDAILSTMRRLAGLITALGVFTAPLRAQAPVALSDSAFVQLIASVSEPPGFFDTDNLISNEDSYLHVVGTLKRLGVTGGAYLGVGPDQNFSYIAAIHPHIAFIIDVRRENLLEHLLFKSIFALSRNRLEYLCLLFGKSAPADTTGWGARDATALLAYVDGAPRDTAAVTRVRTQLKRMAVTLSQDDLATIDRFHRTFVAQGTALRFNTFGRAPQPYDPTYRQLLVQTDRTGRESNYLAHEDDFQFVRALEARNLVVPVVGNFGGAKALASVGEWLREHKETVSAFYTSNVEQYLFRDGLFELFAKSVSQLPRDAHSVMLRSYFLGFHPQNVAGYHATQVAQFIDRFAAAGFQSYYELVTRNVIDP